MAFLVSKKNKFQSGISLVEALVGTAIFVLLVLSVYQAYLMTMNVVRASRIKIIATALANEQFEIMRNLPYADVGILGGLPVGKIPYSQNLIRGDKEFNVKTTIRSIDDPFDGTIGGTPNDSAPADYKLAELEINCATCQNFPTLKLTTYIAPKNLESSSTNGAIFIQVFNSLGQPIPEVNVHIENNQTIPTFTIDDTTNNDGLLQIVDAPPGAEAYEITVSKPGYTTEQTYTVGDPANPTPSKPHATVLTQQLTQISFIIDEFSDLSVTSVNDTCLEIPNIDFSLRGFKLIGTSPEIYKYDSAHTTNSSGSKIIEELEWDTYSINFNDENYNLAGVIPSSMFTIDPGASQNLKLIVAPKNPNSLLITVKDASTGLPLSDVSVQLTATDYDNTLITGRGFIRQTDWSGGAGQENYTDTTKYFDSDGKVEIADPAGVIQLKKVFDEYETDGLLTSSTFDTGSVSNFHQILWQSLDQPVETGVDPVRLQIATNNDNTTWNFKGPDGTANSYYTITDQNISSVHDDDRYLRYKVYLQTADITKTPAVSDVSFTFTSACVPPGQVFFSGLLLGSYTVNISKTGYQPYTNTVDTSLLWQEFEITLTP